MIGPARHARHRAMVLALFSGVVAMAACRGENDGSYGNPASGQDAGVCTRDLTAINDLLAHPVACVSDPQCPSGAFCDSARGACDWECVTDSACGPGGICGCDGRCTGGSGGGSGGGTGTCERNPALLWLRGLGHHSTGWDGVLGTKTDAKPHMEAPAVKVPRV